MPRDLLPDDDDDGRLHIVFRNWDGSRYDQPVRTWLTTLWARHSPEDSWVWVAAGRRDEMELLQSRLKCAYTMICPWHQVDPDGHNTDEDMVCDLKGYRTCRVLAKPERPSEEWQAERVWAEYVPTYP
jgi:hypothetical protein